MKTTNWLGSYGLLDGVGTTVTWLPHVNCINDRNGLVIISSSDNIIIGCWADWNCFKANAFGDNSLFAENNCFKAIPFGDNLLFEKIIASKQIHLAIIRYSKK